MARIRKKPIVVEAYRYLPTQGEIPEGVCFCAGQRIPHIHTMEGAADVYPGDWVITGICRGKYPMRHSLVVETYDFIEEAASDSH